MSGEGTHLAAETDMKPASASPILLRALRAKRRHGGWAKGGTMPAKTEKQRRFMGAELERKREGKQTKTDMSEAELEKMASKPGKKKKDD
jgi:hypothetical protein